MPKRLWPKRLSAKSSRDQSGLVPKRPVNRFGQFNGPVATCITFWFIIGRWGLFRLKSLSISSSRKYRPINVVIFASV